MDSGGRAECKNCGGVIVEEVEVPRWVHDDGFEGCYVGEPWPNAEPRGVRKDGH